MARGLASLRWALLPLIAIPLLLAGCERAPETAAGGAPIGTGTLASPPPPPRPAPALSGGPGDSRMAMRMATQTPAPMPAPLVAPGAADRFANAETNPTTSVQEQPVSTFSLDVDTASYAISRRFLVAGQRPPRAPSSSSTTFPTTTHVPPIAARRSN